MTSGGWEVTSPGLSRGGPESRVDHTSIVLAASWILAVTAVFLLARLLTPQGDGSASLTISGTPFQLPALCSFQRLFAIDCPGCGLTRSFVYAVRGRLSDAWAMHPIGTLLAGYLALTLPERAWRIRRLVGGLRVRSYGGIEMGWIAMLALAAYVRWFWLHWQAWA